MSLISKPPPIPRTPGQGMHANYDPARVLQNTQAVNQRRGAGHKAGRRAIARMRPLIHKPRVPHPGSRRR